MVSKWQNHKTKWNKCSRCSLCEVRNKVALYRGKIPCDVLFIGEAPSTTDDVFGSPFTGPAGLMLDGFIEESIKRTWKVSVGMTNLIGCIPKETKGDQKMDKVPDEALVSCSTRIQDLVDIAKPEGIVFVGKVAEELGSTMFIEYADSSISITHPAAIMRENKHLQQSSIEYVIEELCSVFDNLAPF